MGATISKGREWRDKTQFIAAPFAADIAHGAFKQRDRAGAIAIIDKRIQNDSRADAGGQNASNCAKLIACLLEC